MHLTLGKRVLTPPTALSALGVVVMTYGYMMTGIRNAQEDCAKSGFWNQVTCFGDVMQGFLSGAALIVEGVVITSAALAPTPVRKDIDIGGLLDSPDHDLLHIDGVVTNASMVTHQWMIDNLLNEGDRRHILANTSTPGVKRKFEVWREGEHRKVTTHLQFEAPTQQPQLVPRAADFYLHFSGNHYDIEPIQISSTSLAPGSALAKYMANQGAVRVCADAIAVNANPYTPYVRYSAWFGFAVSGSSSNDAPSTCHNYASRSGYTVWEK